MYTFDTKTNHVLYAESLFLPILIVGALFGGVIWYFMKDFPDVVWKMLGAMVGLYLLGAFFWVSRSNRFILHFEGDEIQIWGRHRKQSFSVYDIPASDIVIKQTRKQRQSDTCHVRIRHTMLSFRYVEKYAALKTYVELNFRKQ